MNAFPWAEAMRLGFGVMRLSSREFWGLTPRELAAALTPNGPARAGAPDRQRLNDLMARFPDGGTNG